MPAQNDLLISTVAADSMQNNGTEFCIDAGTASPARWRVNPQRNLLQLCRQEEVCITRQIEPRLMQLLCLLADANGAVLTRESLMEALWPRVIVNENSLTRAISELRKAFVLPDEAVIAAANDASGCGLIETVPKRGYRLNARLVPDDASAGARSATPGVLAQTFPAKSAGLQTGSKLFFLQLTLRYPAIAAAMVITAALSSLWTLKLTDSNKPSNPSVLVSQSVIEMPGIPTAKLLEDRVLSDSADLPDGLHWLESVHNSFDRIPLQQPWSSAAGSSRISSTVIAPGGQMLAFVEEFPGQSQLRLRSLVSPDEAWTVFTSSSPITHLQWSPLDAGLLFTVEDKDGVAASALADSLHDELHSSARLARLMLLDLETLQIRELYRRVVPAVSEELRTVGSLT